MGASACATSKDALFDLKSGIEDDPLTLGRFKIFFSTIQILGQVNAVQGTVWPEPFQSMMNVYAYLSFSFLDHIP